MKEAYAYKVEHGIQKDTQHYSNEYVVFADSEEIADKHIDTEIRDERANDGYIDDDGQVKYHLWNYYTINKIPVSELNCKEAHIIWAK